MWTGRQVTLSVATLFLLPVGDADSRPSSREAEGPLETLHVNVNLVTVGVRVSDRRNREVSGLKPEEFSIFEDGKQQKLAVFASEQQPVSALILLDRSYSMGESGKLEFRAEFFNTANHANFSTPNRNLGDGNFGRVTDSADPRIIQFGLKFVF